MELRGNLGQPDSLVGGREEFTAPAKPKRQMFPLWKWGGMVPEGTLCGTHSSIRSCCRGSWTKVLGEGYPGA